MFLSIRNFCFLIQPARFSWGSNIWHATHRNVSILLNEWNHILGKKWNSSAISADVERVEATRDQWCAAIRDGWVPLNKNVMLTWWGRWQDANPESGIWQSLSKEQSQCTISQSHPSDFRDPSLQHFQICNTTLLCSSSRKHVCFRCQWTSSYNQFRDAERLVCVTLMPVDRALPGIWSQHLMVIKTCHIWSKYIICWKFNTLLTKSSDNFISLKKINWVKNRICLIFLAAKDLVQGQYR